MGRGLGKNNMSEEELKVAKRERDLASYHKNKHKTQKARALKLLTAKTINCGCGGNYKDIIQNKQSHCSTQRHSLWDEEERLQVRETIIKKVKGINTLEEAQTKLNEIYYNAGRYTLAQKEGHLPTLLTRLNKIVVKITKIKIKKKLNIIIDE